MTGESFFSENSLIFISASIVLLCLCFALDDLFIDAIALVRGLKPTDITFDDLERMRQDPQGKFAILIANWHEADVLEAMITGNLRGIEYDQFVFFLGVYPNDRATCKIARQLARRFPKKVVTVINSRSGPTSKGQMLNEMVRFIMNSPTTRFGKDFDHFLIQDSEDVLHRHSLTVLNHFSKSADFIQLPVFSFPVPWHSLVGGVYIDEFSEPHTKDLLVREHLGAAIPSAGVGTMISKRFMNDLLATNQFFLKEDTLTEDYLLGMTTKIMGYTSKFLCIRLQHEDGRREFIATREYFPSGFMASVRQKTRWVLGIAYEGLKYLGWQGSIVDRYFMYRDRRAPLNGILMVLSSGLFLALVYMRLAQGHLPAFTDSPWFETGVSINLSCMVLRIVQRMRAVTLTHAPSQALMVPLRWFVGSSVNVLAAYRAYGQFRVAERTGQRPAWCKTAHVLPAHFGRGETAEGGK